MKDFVFKHDSVRTIQTALKYATPEQRKMIAKELKGEYRGLVEGRYSKFLVAKILVAGDKETRSMVIEEFYGHVRKLINHPEASWILDDTYRQVASPSQKAKLLREWYGAEYSVLRTATSASRSEKEDDATADLADILAASPEKRRPTLKHLHDMINQLIQKKMTAFTMLHDAMLQYSLAISSSSDNVASGTPNETVIAWIDLLRPDEEADFDLLKNLAFTASGARVVSRALALGNAKDRRSMLRVYKDHIETVACDANAVHVLLTAYEVVDDTKMVSKLIFPELLAAKATDPGEREAAIVALATHPTGRTAILWPFVSDEGAAPRWLVTPNSLTDTVMKEVKGVKKLAGTSKKQDDVRQKELAQAIVSTADAALLSTIGSRTMELAESPLGCQFIMEVMSHAGQGELDDAIAKKLDAALKAVASIAAGDPEDRHVIVGSAAGGRMLKTLAQGGPFDLTTKTTRKVPWLDGFPNLLWEQISENVVKWATGSESFVVLALAENTSFGKKNKLLEKLKRQKKLLQEAVEGGNKGAEMLLGMIG